MIDYIEEMMKTAGVKKNNCGNCNQELDAFCLMDGCDKKGFPDFTAEKQQKLIKLMCDLPYSADFKFEISKQDEDWIVTREIPIKEKETTACYAYSGRSKNFAEALAEVVKDLMNAGELDKQKVKEILE